MSKLENQSINKNIEFFANNKNYQKMSALLIHIKFYLIKLLKI